MGKSQSVRSRAGCDPPGKGYSIPSPQASPVGRGALTAGETGGRMPVKTDNLNLNLNLNLGTSGGGGSAFGRPRYNTEDYAKLAPNVPRVTRLPTLSYSDHWDPEHRAWRFVQEFMLKCTWGANNTPISVIETALNGQANIPVPKTGATFQLDAAELSAQIVAVLNAGLDRADRAMEIMDQASGQGALNYWIGLLRIDPSQDKNTYLLMLVARKIGEYVAMGLKDVYKFRRPSQVYPHIMPAIDPPDTPSYPSSHSLQAHLISGLLKKALPANANQTVAALDHLAGRVAYNREIAGVHYPMDSLAGAYAADQCILKLDALTAAPPLPNPPAPVPVATTYKELVRNAATELVDMP